MEKIKQLFINIERPDIDENTTNLVSDDIIDSVDIMNLVAEIENTFKKKLDISLISPENFEDFQSIKNMIENIK
ncbi:acyl carrier protein [Campylobacter volucris]|uniref:phosphopantetheine-binding protein n=1 Tax=Campylobacter volucris TaxID=1031542 RepID=UPI0010594A1C|nr:phosphopantetheine-binding protein [Campylobacter volucris]TDJ85176.1 acyl carrier protein [Campylobacter volucris]